ncbi:MAG: hypothetical protein IPN68_04420 [Bacteroidetes bacterium]|nr:hypothetical protein [Bacteroidota bacterium]
MKKLTMLLLLASVIIPLSSQVSAEDKLLDLEKSGNSKQDIITATLTSSSRLFKNPDDLTSVIMIIPKGSQVEVLASDSTYLNVFYDGNEGFILRRHAVIEKSQVKAEQQEQQKAVVQKPAEQQDLPMSRFAYLESKYGTSMAARLNANKIWKGMNAEMVKDSWGKPERISREVNGNTIKEEWFYKSTWLYLENNTLIEWGAVKK